MIGSCVVSGACYDLAHMLGQDCEYCRVHVVMQDSPLQAIDDDDRYFPR